MNEYSRLMRLAKLNKELYPAGTRVELNFMEDPWNPVPSGTRGTVVHVDDMGQIHMKWDNGRTLALNSEEDSFRKLSAQELAEEQRQAKPSLDDSIADAKKRVTQLGGTKNEKEPER